ncbi:uba2 [Ecytonucleospora hepatopenaei]|uniref:Uba2 n=1 Tax=Ecytonucleospora hepatopenaei TaxID=646526 RepID=A0A1W0E7Q5_9MICR|nr:uba2 [Ecytonucleospora hepatopenaei]
MIHDNILNLSDESTENDENKVNKIKNCQNITENKKFLELHDKLLKKRVLNVLVVGCGGIGCELVKILHNQKYFKYTLIDYDSVDITNLNRQFYFSKNSVGKPKSLVMGRKMKCKFYNKKIEDCDSFKFWKSFNVVFNCLDNNKARSYVNKRCFLFDIPLIDGGSAGWFGQSYLFAGGFECFDCLPIKTQKTFPICTVKNKPTTFEHCLAWGQFVYDENMQQDSEIINEIENIMDLYNKEFTIKRKKYYTENIKNTGYTHFCITKYKDTLNLDKNNFIYSLAFLRAIKHKIEPKLFIDATTFINNIIPSICTTNAIIAASMVKSLFNVKNYFLAENLLEVKPQYKNQECTTCKMPGYICKFNRKMCLNDIYNRYNYDKIVYNNEEILLKNNETSLIDFNHIFCVIFRKSYVANIYFEFTNTNRLTLEIKRLK